MGNRILHEAWDLGHVFGFAALMFFIIQLSPTYTGLSLVRQFILAGLFAILLGFTVEVIQLYTGRSFSVNDVLLNVIGAITALVFLTPRFSVLDRKIKIFIRVAVILSLLLISKEVFIFSYDAYQAHRQFPVIVDQSTAFELTRWRGSTVKYTIEHFEQLKVLKAEFLPARYSTLVLDYFPRDWSAYKKIKMLVYNPEGQPEKIFIRLHDLAHVEKESPYSDRFNGEFIIEPGWNTFILSLSEIQQAPRRRQMDMRRIHQLMLYFYHLTEKKTLFIREIRLTN